MKSPYMNSSMVKSQYVGGENKFINIEDNRSNYNDTPFFLKPKEIE
jgi:hypothetical protein